MKKVKLTEVFIINEIDVEDRIDKLEPVRGHHVGKNSGDAKKMLELALKNGTLVPPPDADKGNYYAWLVDEDGFYVDSDRVVWDNKYGKQESYIGITVKFRGGPIVWWKPRAGEDFTSSFFDSPEEDGGNVTKKKDADLSQSKGAQVLDPYDERAQDYGSIVNRISIEDIEELFKRYNFTAVPLKTPQKN